VRQTQGNYGAVVIKKSTSTNVLLLHIFMALGSVARRFYLTSLFLRLLLVSIEMCIRKGERDEICSSSIIIKIIAMGTSQTSPPSRHNIIFPINLVREFSSRIYCHFLWLEWKHLSRDNSREDPHFHLMCGNVTLLHYRESPSFVQLYYQLSANWFI
jgi:hypothetical protein